MLKSAMMLVTSLCTTADAVRAIVHRVARVILTRYITPIMQNGTGKNQGNKDYHWSVFRSRDETTCSR